MRRKKSIWRFWAKEYIMKLSNNNAFFFNSVYLFFHLGRIFSARMALLIVSWWFLYYGQSLSSINEGCMLVQGHPSQSVHFEVKILGRKNVFRIIYKMDFLFPEKPISIAITSFFRFWHFRKNVSWFQLFIDIFSKKVLPSGA